VEFERGYRQIAIEKDRRDFVNLPIVEQCKRNQIICRFRVGSINGTRSIKVDSKQEDFPLVLQEPISIVSVSYTDLEAMTLRNVLECFNYRVEIHRVGSRPQFLEILRGNIPTFQHVVLSCHGDENGLVIPYQNPVSATELAQVVHLPGHIIVSLGCITGTEALANAFLSGGCEAYIAPTDYVKANAVLLFAVHLFYFLANKRPLSEAVEESRRHDAECSLFKLWISQTADS